MNHQNTGNHIRPGIVLLVACALAAILIPLGISALHGIKPSSARETLAPPETAGPVAATNQPAPVLSTALDEPWGIQVSSIWLAEEGAALGVSYKVLAPDKATLLSDDSIPVLLIDQSSGAKISLRVSSPMGAVPSHSRARSKALAAQQPWSFPAPRNKLVAGREYSFVISNPEKTVKSGSMVVLVVGNYRTDALTVE